MSGRRGPTKAERAAEAIAAAVSAGEPAELAVPDFSDPERPLTCLEVDFPIIPVNQVAIIEGNAGKPNYQMSKWWARRRSSVFRAMLIAAAAQAPEDHAEAARLVWESYYRRHQDNPAFRALKTADIFMGGGTTLVEGARLGMQLYGTDLNPVAWFVVKNELAQVSREEVEALLADVESAVRPQVAPYYACDCPRGHRGAWTHKDKDRVEGSRREGPDFDPLALSPEERADYDYQGPEIVYVFWAKHGPCQVTGCGHRTPIFTNPVIAVKTLTVAAWKHTCPSCKGSYEVEDGDARMAPGAPLAVAETEAPFAVVGAKRGVRCPLCGAEERDLVARKGHKKKIELSLLVHPAWLAGETGRVPDGSEYGGRVTDDPDATAAWNRARAARMRLLEVRGKLPEEVECPETGAVIRTGKGGGTVPASGKFACGSCGRTQRVVEALEASGGSAPVAAFAIQGYCPQCAKEGIPYGGRFFAAVADSATMDAADREWTARRDEDLASFWPMSELPFGHMTHQRQPLPHHGYRRWADMFNPRQLLVHAQLLRAIVEAGGKRHRWEAREYVLGAFQQYLRNQNMFCFWDLGYDKLCPLLSNANFHPKANLVENGVFGDLGRGNWASCAKTILDGLAWCKAPWDVASNERLSQQHPELAGLLTGKSSKVSPCDPVGHGAEAACASATDLSALADASFDLVITDPPFGGILHYSEPVNFSRRSCGGG